MNNFKQTNPDDNPVDDDGKTDRDRELEAAKQNRAEDRPAGVTGVDKAHGGGSAGLEAATDAMRGVGSGPGPRPNNNNPSDPTNPQNNLGGAGSMSDGEARRAEYSQPRTTADEELPSKRETRETAEREAGERREEEQRKQRDDREKNLAANQDRRTEEQRKEDERKGVTGAAGQGSGGAFAGIGSNKRPADPDGTPGNKNRPDV